MSIQGYKHGLKGTPEYSAWVAMRQRCNNPHGHDAYYYKDITVCPEWNSVEQFVLDMGKLPNHRLAAYLFSDRQLGFGG